MQLSRLTYGRWHAEYGIWLIFFPFFSLDLTHNIAEHFFVFQADGEENCFQWPGMRHINSGTGMHFGPVEKATKCLLVFIIQTLAKLLPPSVLPGTTNTVSPSIFSTRTVCPASTGGPSPILSARQSSPCIQT
jgi:hypothetical protein